MVLIYLFIEIVILLSRKVSFKRLEWLERHLLPITDRIWYEMDENQIKQVESLSKKYILPWLYY